MFQFTHPGRGATSSGNNLGNVNLCFNSRTPGGVRQFHKALKEPHLCFNSRTPGGVRRLNLLVQSSCDGFNSRTPGGVRRLQREDGQFLPSVSIHAPREGCDMHAWRNHHRPNRVSIHAPREGCDSRARTPRQTHCSFNSRTPGGVRPGWSRCSPNHYSFNSRTPGGVRLRTHGESLLKELFQFTHPGRGATTEYT